MSRRLATVVVASCCVLVGACSRAPSAPAPTHPATAGDGPTDPASLKALELNPALYWPLNEGKGAVRFAEATGHGPSMGLDHSKYGDGVLPAGGADAAGDGALGLLGVAFTPGKIASRQQAATILGVGPLADGAPTPVAVPATVGSSWTVSVACWVELATRVDPQMAVLAITSSGGREEVPIGLQGDGSVFYEDANGSTFGQVSASDRATITDGAPHLLVGEVHQDATTTTVTLYVDGAQVATASRPTGSVGGMLTAPATSVLIGGSDGEDGFTYVANGIIGKVGIWGRALSAGEVADLWAAGKP